MGRAQGRSTLSQSIAEILGTAEPDDRAVSGPGPFRKSLIYSSMALLAINPVAVNAVGLGELNVNSQLGQPLNATVPVTLAPGESMPKDCVATTRGNSGIAAPGKLRVSNPAATQPGTYNLRVTTTNALHEPLYEISLLINCPGTPLLVRQYVLMLDLPGMTVAPPVTHRGDMPAVPATAVPTTSLPLTQAPIPATNQRTARPLQRSGTMISAGKPYRVSEGDTLSTIAARIDGRSPDTTWSVANLIFSMNPQAFIRNNPNLIKLGSLINIPDVAELAGLETGHTAISSIKAPVTDLKQTTTLPDSLGDKRPAPAPVPTPVTAPAAMNRPEVFVTEPKPEQSESSTPYSAKDTGADLSEEAYQPYAVQPTLTSPSDSPDTAIITPFLDEQPVVADSVDTAIPAADAGIQPIPVTTKTTESEPSEPVNPLLAILVGILLGVLVSLLTFRRQLIDAIVGLFRRRTPADAKGALAYRASSISDHEDTVDGTDSFDTSMDESAFDIQQENSEPLPISSPAESTYIVEASEAEATVQIGTPDSDSDTFENLDESQATSDDEMLAMLFDENDSTLGELDDGIFDPTGGIDTAATGTFSGPTAEMPARTAEQGFDPTAELPSEFEGEIFDPTAEMPSGLPDMLFDDELPVDEISNEPTLESELDALPSSDEDSLSETLQEALSMLESDFEDEFTASQILERSEISRALDEK